MASSAARSSSPGRHRSSSPRRAGSSIRRSCRPWSSAACGFRNRACAVPLLGQARDLALPRVWTGPPDPLNTFRSGGDACHPTGPADDRKAPMSPVNLFRPPPDRGCSAAQGSRTDRPGPLLTCCNTTVVAVSSSGVPGLSRLLPSTIPNDPAAAAACRLISLVKPLRGSERLHVGRVEGSSRATSPSLAVIRFTTAGEGSPAPSRGQLRQQGVGAWSAAWGCVGRRSPGALTYGRGGLATHAAGYQRRGASHPCPPPESV